GNYMLASFVEIGGYDLERDQCVLDPLGDAVREYETGEPFAIDLERSEAASLQQVAEPRTLHPEQVFGRLHAVGEDMAGMIADFLGRDAGRIGRPPPRAETAAGNDRGIAPPLVE